jgi:hypothetical protein
MSSIKGLEEIFKGLGVHELFPADCNTNKINSKIISAMCKTMPSFCELYLSGSDANPKYDNIEQLHKFVKYFPSGSSVRSLLHFK